MSHQKILKEWFNYLYYPTIDITYGHGQSAGHCVYFMLSHQYFLNTSRETKDIEILFENLDSPAQFTPINILISLFFSRIFAIQCTPNAPKTCSNALLTVAHNELNCFSIFYDFSRFFAIQYTLYHF
jgi:hypothetical protein